MPPPPFSQEDAERVRRAADVLVEVAPTLVGKHPLFAVAALTMAACHAAMFTDTSYETLAELLKLHYVAAETGQAAHDAGAPTIRPPEGQS